jgi:hypothetical protein
MELHKIEQILDLYFEGETTIEQENELAIYFSEPNVAQHLKQYQPLFQFYQQEKNTVLPTKKPKKSKKQKVVWLSIAASAVVFFGVGTFAYNNFLESETTVLGTYQNPEDAFEATQKALNLISTNVNVGVQSVQQLNEFENSKNKIFIQ